jgi:hypothetical protein
VSLRKRHDVFEVGAAPRVDALGVVADGHHAVVRGDLVDDLRLNGVIGEAIDSIISLVDLIYVYAKENNIELTRRKGCRVCRDKESVRQSLFLPIH